MKNKNLNELLNIAKSTSCSNEMDFLQKHPQMNIRRELAKNNNISEQILQKLLDDPVQNVSYMASLHGKSHKLDKKEFNDLSSCVICEKEQTNLNCTGCEKVEDHSF